MERKWIGGACPNIACMPSKNEISSARVAHFVRNAGEFGWTLRKVAAVVRHFEFLDLRSVLEMLIKVSST